MGNGALDPYDDASDDGSSGYDSDGSSDSTKSDSAGFDRVLKADEPAPVGCLDLSRRAVRDYVTQSQWFDPLILLCIIGSSVTLAISDPLAADGDPTAERLAVADIVFLAIFTAEMFLKMFAHGVIGELCGVDPFRRNNSSTERQSLED